MKTVSPMLYSYFGPPSAAYPCDMSGDKGDWCQWDDGRIGVTCSWDSTTEYSCVVESDDLTDEKDELAPASELTVPPVGALVFSDSGG